MIQSAVATSIVNKCRWQSADILNKVRQNFARNLDIGIAAQFFARSAKHITTAESSDDPPAPELDCLCCFVASDGSAVCAPETYNFVHWVLSSPEPVNYLFEHLLVKFDLHRLLRCQTIL